MRFEHTFLWATLENKFAAEWAACRAALAVLDENAYAGWVTPLVHPSREYPHFGYVALKILIEVNEFAS